MDRALDTRRGDGSSETEWVLRATLDSLSAHIALVDASGEILLTNEAWRGFARSNGSPPREVSEGTNYFQVCDSAAKAGAEDAAAFAEGLRSVFDGRLKEFAMEYPCHSPTKKRWFVARVTRFLASGVFEGAVIAHEDVTERKLAEEMAAHQALHDPLTGLPNRALFLDRLKHAMDRAERGGEGVAVLFVDLDDFKHVNDSFGHGAGDALLVDVVKRVGGCLRPGDTLARLGGDEFAVLLEETEAPPAKAVAGRIARELGATPVTLDGREVFPTASIGIALWHPKEGGPLDLLGNADVAMYVAKRSGKSQAKFYDPSMRRHSNQRHKLESDLRGAVGRGEIAVCYQPVVSIPSGEIVGVEALARWEHPERGLLLPEEFVPLAEETGLIVPVGLWVLREACRQARQWRASFPDRSFSVSVNLSARQLRDPELLGEVEAALREAELPPAALILEITEGISVENAGPMEETLWRLSAHGIGLAIDDFGKGYSSLKYLGHLPVRRVKLDRALVAGIDHDPSRFMIALSTIGLSHSLGLEVVAEGVQTRGEAAKLRVLKCDFGQGYHWWRPLGSREVADVLG